MKREELLSKHPWLSSKPQSFEEYLDHSYYDRILKPYTFGGKDDLSFLSEAAHRAHSLSRCLELGPGSGRATKILLSMPQRPLEIVLVDRSKQMLESCKERFAHKLPISYVLSDSLEFLATTDKKFDFAFSMWSFSHSIHQALVLSPTTEKEAEIRSIIEKFVKNSLSPNGEIFIMHFDSLSEEQAISIRQRGRKYPFYKERLVQSPSKLILDAAFKRLSEQGVVEFSCEHLKGDPIRFVSLEEALEYYFNFHMESVFNDSDEIGDIIDEVSKDLLAHMDADGSISVCPGCFIYSVKKIASR